MAQDPRNFPQTYLDNLAANSAMNEAITAMNGIEGINNFSGGMDQVLGQLQAQMEMVSNTGTKQKPQ